MPKKVNIDVQRQMIATAAIGVIDQSGLEKTRLRDVARAGNMTTGTVTHYFDGKDAVLEAALEEVVRRTLDRIDTGSASALATNGNIAAFVKQICCYLPVDETNQKEWRVWLAFWGRAIADERLRRIHHDYYQGFVDRLAGHMLPFEKVASKQKTRKCADAVIAALDGVGTRATLEPDEWTPKRQRETLTSLLMPMLTEFAKKGSNAKS
ncbi:MAG: TetR/AcrR family transcriptional regulator [Rhizobiaceae bacterium]